MGKPNGKGDSTDLEGEFLKSEFATELKKEASRITQGLTTEVRIQQQLISYPSSFLKQVRIPRNVYHS